MMACEFAASVNQDLNHVNVCFVFLGCEHIPKSPDVIREIDL
jgi:hypothetical protein